MHGRYLLRAGGDYYSHLSLLPSQEKPSEAKQGGRGATSLVLVTRSLHKAFEAQAPRFCPLPCLGRALGARLGSRIRVSLPAFFIQTTPFVGRACAWQPSFGTDRRKQVAKPGGRLLSWGVFAAQNASLQRRVLDCLQTRPSACPAQHRPRQHPPVSGEPFVAKASCSGPPGEGRTLLTTRAPNRQRDLLSRAVETLLKPKHCNREVI